MHKSLSRTLLIMAIIAAVAPLTAFGQPLDTLWTRVYGGTSFDNAGSGQQTTDGGFIMAGRADSYGNGAQFWLVKTNASGDTLWTRTYGPSSTESAYSVQQTTDGGYIMAGYTNTNGLNDAWLVKTNANGDTAGGGGWAQIIGDTGDDMAFSVLQTGTGLIVFTGYKSVTDSAFQVWLYGRTATGQALFNRTYGGTNYDLGKCVIQTSDGGFAIVGYAYSYGAGQSDVYLIKTNLIGVVQWSTTYGGTGLDQGNCIQQTSDGGFIIVGETNLFGEGGKDVWLIKTNADGDTLWTRTYGNRNDDVGNSVRQTADGGYVITGSKTGQGNNVDLWVIKTDANGDTLWTQTLGGGGTDVGNSIALCSDGGYFIAGQTQSFGAGIYDAWLIRYQGPPMPQILVSPGVLDYDSVLVNTSANLPLTIYNVGTATLVLYNLTGADSAYTTNYNQADSLIVPGDSLNLTVTFGPTDTVVYNDTLMITSNDQGVNVLLNGRGYAPEAVGDRPMRMTPTTYALQVPSPNPFNPMTTIHYDLPAPSQIRLEVYDIYGRSVGILAQGWRQAGSHAITFNATGLASGVYVCRLTAGTFTASEKMVLMK